MLGSNRLESLLEMEILHDDLVRNSREFRTAPQPRGVSVQVIASSRRVFVVFGDVWYVLRYEG